MPIHRIQSDLEGEAFLRSLARRFVLALAALAGIVLASTLALAALGVHAEAPLGERLFLSLWDTLNLISTVGSLEQELTRGQRAWAMLVITFGLGAVLYAFGTLQGLLHSGDVRKHFARKRVKAMLEERSGHDIVCGYGQVGRVVARDLRAAGRDVVVIERDDEAAAAADEAGYIVVHADGTNERTLVEAGVERAASLIATLANDSANVYLILIARELHPRLVIVARADSESTRPTLRRAGANRVIVPGEIAGAQLSHLVRKPRMSEFIAGAIGEGEFEFLEIEVDRRPDLAGRRLAEAELPDVIVISVLDESGTQHFDPPRDRVLAAGDTVLAIGRGGPGAG